MPKQASKRKKKQILNIVFLVLLIGVTVAVIFGSHDINLSDIGKFLGVCDPWFIVAAVGGMIGYILFEAISLHLIVRRLGHKSKARASLAYSSSDLYYSAITPSASGGQPASVFYMMRDGISGGTAWFSVLFNLIAYTVATVLVGVFALIFKPAMFGQMASFPKALVILGFAIQFLLLGFLLMCLLWSGAVLKVGNFGITLLNKMHLMKHPDKWRDKFKKFVEKYSSCRGVFKQHPALFPIALLLNICQRVSQTLIPCFVVFAADTHVDFLTLFCMQAYVLIGYNSIPLPGGTGAYEYLYPNIFGIGGYDMTFILSAMMVSRFISYYMCMIISGAYTLVYHFVGIKKASEEGKELPSMGELDINAVDLNDAQDPCGNSAENIAENNTKENTDAGAAVAEGGSDAQCAYDNTDMSDNITEKNYEADE